MWRWGIHIILFTKTLLPVLVIKKLKKMFKTLFQDSVEQTNEPAVVEEIVITNINDEEVTASLIFFSYRFLSKQ